jgi:hypothetical protein
LAHREFNTHRRQASGERVTFNIPNADGTADVFDCAADPPGGVMLDVANISEGSRGEQVLAIGRLLDGVLLPDSRDRFEKRMRDPLNPITLDDAIDVVSWLAQEVYSGRPTVPSSPSAPSALSTGPRSTDDLPSTASTS